MWDYLKLKLRSGEGPLIVSILHKDMSMWKEVGWIAPKGSLELSITFTLLFIVICNVKVRSW